MSFYKLHAFLQEIADLLQHSVFSVVFCDILSWTLSMQHIITADKWKNQHPIANIKLKRYQTGISIDGEPLTVCIKHTVGGFFWSGIF